MPIRASRPRSKPKAPTKIKAETGPAARKRERSDSGTDKRFVRHDDARRFKDVVDVGGSLAAERRQAAKEKSNIGPGQSRRSAAKEIGYVAARA